MKIEILESETMFAGLIFDVRRDQVRLPDQRVTHYDLIVHPGAVTLVPIDEQGNVWFVRQYRHAAAKILLELPAGTLEPGESPEECALREAREEIGLAPDELKKLGDFFLAPGYSSEFMHVFLATNLQPSPLPADPNENLSPESIPRRKVLSMLDNGIFQDAKTLASLSLARHYLGNPD